MIFGNPGMIFAIFGIMIGIIASGYIQAYAAYKLGDTRSTIRERQTLNPKMHIDILGLACIFLVGFGWGKSVQVNENNLRDPDTDPIKIALSGVSAYALTALFFTLLYAVFSRHIGIDSIIINTFFIYTIYINWSLFFFNMIPFPPFTGSIVLFHWLKKNNPSLYIQLYTYSSGILLLLIIVSNIFGLGIFSFVGKISEYWGNFFLRLVGM